MSDLRLPNESEENRAACSALLEEELALRAQVERVAEQRRQLPAGGELKEDYAFGQLVAGEVVERKLSELFAPGRSTLFIYSFMYGPDMDAACPMCTSILDGLDAQVPHIAMIEGGHMRHLDLIWPLWGVLDLTPEGRGDFMPALRY